jgi:hypothetical protein
MALKDVPYVSGWQTSDGKIHPEASEATSHQNRLDLIDVLKRAPATAEGVADFLLERYTIYERKDFVELPDEWPSGNFGQPPKDGAQVKPPQPDEDDDIPF